MLAGKEKVLELIPQKPPMVMVDGLLSTDDTKTVSSLTIEKGNLFLQNGVFGEPGMIENVAQTAALRAGYQAFVSGKKPLTGFIGSVKKFKIFNLPKEGDRLKTVLTVLTELGSVSVVKGEVWVNDRLFAQGEMNIFLQDTPSQ